MSTPGTSTALLIHRYLVGIKNSFPKHIAFVDENQVVYPCGHNAVIHSIESKEQQFIHGIETTSADAITAFGVSTNRRYVAVAERGEKPAVHIHDVTTLRRRKTLHLPETGSDAFISIAFSSDNRFCLTQTGSPDWTLSLWLWEKSKLVHSLKTTVPSGSTISQVDFNPYDSTTVCVSGNGILKFYKFVDGQLRQQTTPLKREVGNFLCHAWVSENQVIAAVDSGELWLIEEFEFRLVLPSSPIGDGSTVNCILGYSKGFVCGGSGGLVRLYDRSEDAREVYRRTKTFGVEGNTNTIVDIAISPAEDSLVCSLEDNQLYVLTLSSTDILKEDAMNFELLSTPFHSGGITGLDTCVRKPLIATCGKDKSIRVWNYLDHTMELMRTFKETLHSIAFHPSGFHLVVGFTDKLKMLNLLMDDIRPFREFAIKGCREVRFSHGGQYFAAVNNNVVQVYATYTGELVSVLRGHSNRVMSVCWRQDDRRLTTCGADGAILLWDLRTATKVGDGHSHARCTYTDAVHYQDGDVVYASGTDGALKEVDVVTGSTKTEHWPNVTFGPMALAGSQQILYVGCSESGKPGTVRAYKLPLEKKQGAAASSSSFTPASEKAGFQGSGAPSTALGSNTGPVFFEYQCHDAQVTRMRISSDYQYLFTTGEDGCLSIFETRDVVVKANNGMKGASGKEARMESGNTSTNGNGLAFAEEILVTKSDLEEKHRVMTEFKNKVDELILQNEYQLRLKDMNYNEKMKEVSDKFSAELAQDKQRCADLQQDKTAMELDYTKKMEKMSSVQKQELEELKEAYEAKVVAEKERLMALEESREQQNAAFESENHVLVEGHTQSLSEKTTEYDQKIGHEQALQAKSTNAKEALVQRNETLKRHLEEDGETEVEELKLNFEVRLREEREATLRLKGENGIMKKKYASLQKDIEDQKEEIRSLEDKSRELLETIKGLEKDIQGHKKEIREREETIQDKEKRIYDLKKKNQELEKFKFVLDYKIKELKRQIEPREQEIATMRTQIQDMDAELEQYHKSNAALDLTIGELRLKMDGMQKEIEVQMQEMARGRLLKRQVQTDLLHCAHQLEDKKSLKASMIALNKKYEESVEADSKEPDSQLEYNRQREYLEKEVESLKKKLLKGMHISETELHRMQRENAVLTTQVNEMRREYHQVRMEMQETKGKKKMVFRKAKATDRDGGDEKRMKTEYQKQSIKQLREKLRKLEVTLGGGLKRANSSAQSGLKPRFTPSPKMSAPRKPTSPTSQRLPPV